MTTTPSGRPALAEDRAPGDGPVETTLPLAAETITLGRTRRETGRVRVTVTTHSEDHRLDEDLLHETVEIDRLPINRPIEAVPPIREEGGTVIIPVVEEVLVMERRLMLKEEVHLRRVQVRVPHHETVTIRRQEAIISRLPAPPPEESDPLATPHHSADAEKGNLS